MRPTFRSLGKTILTGLALAVVTTGTALAAPPIPISSPGAVLDQPGGSYYLTQNLDGTGHLFTLVIAASNVKLDLKGKTIDGHFAAVDGILILPGVSNVFITGGTITGYAAGIQIADAQKVAMRNLTVRRNLVGIVGGRSGHSVTYNLIADNGFDGVYLVGDNHQVCYNRVVRNGNTDLLDEFLGGLSVKEPKKGCEGSTAGIRIEGNNAKIICNFASNNLGFGISAEGNNHVIYNNTACFNCRSGVRLRGDNSVINRNRASENEEHGIRLPRVSDYNRIEDNVALKNKKEDIWDGNLPNNCTNEYDNNLFATSNDPTGTCIK